MTVQVAPSLLEDAVLHAVRFVGPDAERDFLLEREDLYDLGGREREVRLAELHREWAARLRLLEPLERAFEAIPGLASQVPDLVVARATRSPGADLGQDVVLCRVRPRAFLDPEGLEAFLHHELTHVADLLDPSFGHPPPGDGAPASPIVRDRLASLWDVSVDGRLTRRGLSTVAGLKDRWREVRKLFRAAPRRERWEAFVRLWEGPIPPFDALEQAARLPYLLHHWITTKAGVPAVRTGGFYPGAPCPLCRFPTHEWARPDHPDHERVMKRIRTRRPDVGPGDRVCTQCFEATAFRAGLWTPVTAAEGNGKTA